MPDIDVDFPDNRRNEVIEHIHKKYGDDHVGHVIAYQTFGARMSLRDSAKAMGAALSAVDALMKKFLALTNFLRFRNFMISIV